MNEVTDTLRRFNRSYTQRIGVLDESFLGTGRPLGPARLLFEIGPTGAGVLDLRERLGLDSAYISRMLRRLESEGAVRVTQDPADARRRIVRLTERGRVEWATLDDRSDDLAAGIVAALSPRQQARLADALNTAERLLRSATTTFATVDPKSPDAVWALEEYFTELDRRFPQGFDVAGALADDGSALRPPDGAFVVGRQAASTVACGGVQRVDRVTYEIKRMWVHPGARGDGLGASLLGHLEERAAQLGADRVVLDTNSVLTEAIALYERTGYRPTERYNDNPYALRWFEKTLPARARASRPRRA